MKKYLLFLLMVMSVLSCRKDKIVVENEPIRYSFFVAGHTFGSPTNYVGGIYPPFKSKFPLIYNDSLIQMGFLTGDIVKYSTVENWDSVDNDLNQLNIPIHYVVGNHEATNMPLFTERYGESYYSFTSNGDLFIVLDCNLDGWHIKGDQLDFLESVLNQNSDPFQKVFIFTHQVLYNKVHAVSPNSEEGLDAPTNFKTEVLPLLEKTNKNIYLFAGDVGAFESGTSIFHHKHKNITFIASGMGGGLRDNFVIVDVSSNHQVRFRLIPLNGNDINALGKIEDY